LYGGGGDAAGAAVDDDNLAGADLRSNVKGVVGRRVVRGQSCCVLRRHVLGYRAHVDFPGHCQIGKRAVADLRDAHYASTYWQRGLGPAFADASHEFNPGHRARLLRYLIFPANAQQVGEREPGSLDRHQQLTHLR
jgi:hypothetical protein